MATHELRTNTATRITVGPFLDKTDGVTPETGITVTACKLTMTVDSAGVPTLVLDTNPTASGGSNDMVHITGDDAGMYDLELTAANLNYVGNGKIILTDAATHVPVIEYIHILPEDVWDSKYNVTGPAYQNGIIDQGTAQSATASTVVLRAAAAFADNELVGTIIVASGGTGFGQARFITANVGSTDTVTVSPDFTTTLSGTIKYKLFAAPPAPTSTASLPAVNVAAWLGTAVATPTVAGVPEVDITHFNGTAGTFAAGIPEVKVASIASNAITAASIATDAITAAKVADGTIDANTFAASAITANAIATDALTAAKIAADVATELQAGLSTLTAAGVRAAVGLASANLDTQLTTINTAAAAILVDTGTTGVLVDSTTPVNADVKKVNGTTVQGAGVTGNKWRPV